MYMILRPVKNAALHNQTLRCDLSFKNISTAARLQVSFKLKIDIHNCYSFLNVPENCSLEDLKAAYIDKAKDYHPDSKSVNADTTKFSQLQEAYKTILEYRNQQSAAISDEELQASVFNFKYKAPQHRQYLTYEGIGTGTPGQRLRTYQQFRVARATEAVLEHKIERLAMQTEDALVIKDKREARKIKISNAIDRLVEDLIQEAMKKGDFRDLSGIGKPLDHSSRNPLVDSTTHNINKILINNGYAPEWITLQREIRQGLKREREKLAVVIKQVGPPPLSSGSLLKLQKQKENFGTALQDINLKIDKFNMIVPFMNQQMVPFNLKRQWQKVEENFETYLPKESETNSAEVHTTSPEYDVNYVSDGKRIEWKTVWKNIREVFK